MEGLFCELRLEGDDTTINRTQALVLGFFGLVWASLVVLFAVAPDVYGRALGLSSAEARLLFLVAISAFVALLGMGVNRRWRWAFWLIFVAFLFGPLRVVASVLALSGVLPADGRGTCCIRPRSGCCSSS